MATTPAPYTVEIPLKPTDRAEACPEVERCQLAVDVWPKQQALAMVDTGMGTRAVQVKLKREGKGCDATVSVGLVESGGPIAVGGESTVWERRLNGCKDVAEPLFEAPPVGLLCARYMDSHNNPASLIVAQLNSNDWVVMVSRQGADVFKKEFKNKEDSLYISAALSPNCSHLYIVESRALAGSDYVLNYGWYTYSQKEWSMYHYGSLTPPAMIPLRRPGIVNRDGWVRSVWAIDQIGRTDIYTDDGTCAAPQVVPGETRQNTYLDRRKVWGGYWDLVSGCAWRDGDIRIHGQVYAHGDLSPEYESITSPYSMPTDTEAYRWSGQPEPGSITATGHREQFVERTNRLTFATHYSGQQTRDLGEEWHFYGQSEHTATLNPQTGIITTVHHESCSFSHSDGIASVSVTSGGWVMYYDHHTSYQPTVPLDYTEVGETSSWNGTWNLCPSMMYRVTTDMIPVETEKTTIVYPVSLGERDSIVRSFTSIDQERGDLICGAYVTASKGTQPSWRIFKNGDEITAMIADCIGRPMDDLFAIYWRA